MGHLISELPGPLYKDKVKCSAFDVEMINANNTSQEKLCTWPHFESEGFWNSEVAYNCVFCKSRYTRNCPPGGEFNKGFSNAGRHEHSFISATGIKSRTDLAQTAGKDRRNRDQVDSRVCASTLLRTAYIKYFMPFYF